MSGPTEYTHDDLLPHTLCDRHAQSLSNDKHPISRNCILMYVPDKTDGACDIKPTHLQATQAQVQAQAQKPAATAV
jgi:hypothetical protein